MEDISLDYNNPYLYVGGVATVSMLMNVYCCYRNCKANKAEKNKLQTKKVRNNNKQYKKREENIELTRQFENVVLPKFENIPEPDIEAGIPAAATTTTTGISTASQTQSIDEATNTKLEPIEEQVETTESTTQTEDCELYEMMGERFSQELEFYKQMNIKKR